MIIEINSRTNSNDITGLAPKCLSFDIIVDDDDNEFHVAEVELDSTIEPKCPFYDISSQADAFDIDLRSSGHLCEPPNIMRNEDPEDDGKAQTDDLGHASRASPALQDASTMDGVLADMIMDRMEELMNKHIVNKPPSRHCDEPDKPDQGIHSG